MEFDGQNKTLILNILNVRIYDVTANKYEELT